MIHHPSAVTTAHTVDIPLETPQRLNVSRGLSLTSEGGVTPLHLRY